MFFYLLNISLPFHIVLDYCVWCGLSVCWKFLVPLYCGSCWMSCQGFLVREAYVSVLVGGTESLLSEVQ